MVLSFICYPLRLATTSSLLLSLVVAPKSRLPR